MKWSSLALIGFCLIAAGCGDAAQRNSAYAAPANAAKAAPPGHVSGFTAPDLAGLVVRDHPEGAQVVTRPRACGDGPTASAADSATCFTYKPCMVLTAVNGTAVRNAAHFRDLMNGVEERQEERAVGWRNVDCP